MKIMSGFLRLFSIPMHAVKYEPTEICAIEAIMEY